MRTPLMFFFSRRHHTSILKANVIVGMFTVVLVHHTSMVTIAAYLMN